MLETCGSSDSILSDGIDSSNGVLTPSSTFYFFCYHSLCYHFFETVIENCNHKKKSTFLRFEPELPPLKKAIPPTCEGVDSLDL